MIRESHASLGSAATKNNDHFCERKTMKTTQRISCYHCRFFAAAGNGRGGHTPTCTNEPYRQGDSGFCHRDAPQHGRLVKTPNGDTVVGLGQWPKVFTHDWCGQFERRAVSTCDNGCPFKSFCSPRIKEMCQKQRPENN